MTVSDPASPGPLDPDTPPDGLHDVHRALLERLAAGDTIAEAAAAEFLSLRTANRRIAEVRRHYGTTTTRDAVQSHQRQEHASEPATG